MKVSTIQPRYILLKPVKTCPNKENIRVYNTTLTKEQVEKYVLGPASKDLCAVDIETRGLTPFYQHTYKDEKYNPCIMGIGFGWYSKTRGYSAAYINVQKQKDSVLRYICERLSQMHLIAHNAMFDGLWLRKLGLDLGVDTRPNWVADTYGYYKQLAPQDFQGQGHGLKNAQVELLGWDEKGDVELDNWLINQGYYTESGKKGERVRRAAKGEMWRVPTHTLGMYCGLDCVSTLQLFDKVLEPVIRRFPMMWEYHDGPYIRTIQELIDQQIHGVSVNVQKLYNAKADVLAKMQQYETEFFEVEEIQKHLKEWRASQVLKITVPKRLKKNGEVSKNYLNYLEKVRTIMKDTKYSFNIGSDKQLQWLFYERMYENKAKTITYNYRDIPCYELQSPRGEILLPATQAGGPPVDNKALPWLGKAGEIIAKYKKESTTLSTFIEPYITYAETAVDGRHHPGWKVPQAVTGRLGGSKPNYQQITGDKRVLECIEADPGYIIVEADFASLEDYVAANVTQCPGLLALYGPDAKENDGHLWLGSQLPVIGDRIKEYYDPNNPTSGSIKEAKEKCKKERDISKKVKYSCVTADTEVLTKDGWKRIVDVGTRKVWDGEEFVNHEGLVDRGIKEVINYNGIRITRDHDILTNKGWEISERADLTTCVRPHLPCGSWTEVWRLGGHILHCAKARWVQVCTGILSSCRK